MVHTCDALIVSCIDFRFQKYIRGWLRKKMSKKLFDYVAFAGGTKDLITILNQLSISVRLHHIKEVALMHHEDCGAYGKTSTHENHTKDLRKARQTIQSLYPSLTVDTYYIHLDGQFEKIK